MSAQPQNEELSQEELHDRYLRAMAELDNVRKRSLKTVATAREQAQDNVLLNVTLPMVDDLERALDSTKNEGKGKKGIRQFREGLELLHRQTVRNLADIGVEPIQSLGQPFSPSCMEALAEVVTDQTPEGHVHGEVLKGYTRDGRLLRAAQVAVAKRP